MPRWRAPSFSDLPSAVWQSFLFLLVCAFFTATRQSHAAESALHVVIVGRPTSPLLQRLREESEVLGFVVDAKARASGSLEAELDTPGVVAAIRELDPPNEALEVVIADPQLRERLRETLPIGESTDLTAKEVVATRAIELLRAVRLHVEQATPQTRAPAPVPPVEAPVAPTGSPVTTIALAPLLSYAPHFEFASSADLSLSYVPRQVGFRAGLLVPLMAQRLEHAGGDITATATAIHATLVARTSARLAWGLELGVGIEASRVHFEGHAQPPLVNVGSNSYTIGPRFEVSGALRLASRLRLLLPLSLSYAFPRTVIRFAGEPINDWGLPLFRAGLGLEWVAP